MLSPFRQIDNSVVCMYKQGKRKRRLKAWTDRQTDRQTDRTEVQDEWRSERRIKHGMIHRIAATRKLFFKQAATFNHEEHSSLDVI